jgi:Domain of unknown function (DUF4331)
MTRRRKLATKLGAALLVAAALPLGSQVNAADHRDAPGTMADRYADLNDVYAWYNMDNDTFVVVVTFNPLLAPDAPVTDSYNPDELPNVLYTIHIDNDSVPLADASDWDNQDGTTFGSDIQVQVRFGQNGLEEWGFQVENLPGATDTLVGPVDEVLTDGTASATAGIFDDPFFFDLDGFFATRDNLDMVDDDPADLGFRSLAGELNNDSFAGVNTMAIVLEMDASATLGGNPDNFVQIWATSGRAP